MLGSWSAARWAVSRQLGRVSAGGIEIQDGDRRYRFGEPRVTAPLRAAVTVRHPAAWSRVALGGTIGAAEGYARGEWTVDDLTALVRIFARNRDLMDGVDSLAARLARPIRALRHRLRPNNVRGSRRNIQAHYDLGNDFFAAILDPTMMYSCARFPTPEADVETASIHKVDQLCRALDLRPGDRLLEIGGGWGWFAAHAARAYGADVVTTTISPAQFAVATRRIDDLGLASRVTVLNADYRHLSSLSRQFDRIVSVEMIEAVGLRHLQRYFSICRDLLAPGGRMALQSIVIADDLFEAYCRSVDFIQLYVFPGGCLPSLELLRRTVADTAGLALAGVEDITTHYPPTLRAWRQNLRQHWNALLDRGYPESLLRLWEYYFCYSEGGFLERTIGTVQLLIERRV
jgi:cyclopropane-fatty-acyl-phospholipid synthase